MQKKFSLLATACLCSLLSFAQINKGTVVAHFDVGNLNSLHIENKNFEKHNHLFFNPGIGYFIKNNFEIGVGLNLSNFLYRDTLLGGYKQNSHTIGINLYTNYYFGKGNLKPYLTFQTGWNNSWGNYTNSGVQNNFNRSSIYAGIGGGLNWNISSRFAFYTEAKYMRVSPFNLSGYRGLNWTVGARFFFNGRKK